MLTRPSEVSGSSLDLTGIALRILFLDRMTVYVDNLLSSKAIQMVLQCSPAVTPVRTCFLQLLCYCASSPVRGLTPGHRTAASTDVFIAIFIYRSLQTANLLQRHYSDQIPTGSLRIRMVCVLLWIFFPSSTCKKRYKKMPYIGKVKKTSWHKSRAVSGAYTGSQ